MLSLSGVFELLPFTCVGCVVIVRVIRVDVCDVGAVVYVCVDYVDIDVRSYVDVDVVTSVVVCCVYCYDDAVVAECCTVAVVV